MTAVPFKESQQIAVDHGTAGPGREQPHGSEPLPFHEGGPACGPGLFVFSLRYAYTLQNGNLTFPAYRIHCPDELEALSSGTLHAPAGGMRYGTRGRKHAS